MFSKLALFTAASLAVFVVALPQLEGGIDNSCNDGQVYCCKYVLLANSTAAQKEIELLGILVPMSDTVGLVCGPITSISLSQQSCTSQPACCTGSNFGIGAVVLGCSPINVSV